MNILERQAARRYWHEARTARRRCHNRWCLPCWRDQILGRHRRERARLEARFAASKARTDACQHEWTDMEIAGRIMPHCDKCGTTRWIRPPS